MDPKCKIKLYAVTIDCPDPDALAAFYAVLLGWVVPYSDEEYACIAPPGTAQGQYPGITFQKNEDYLPPVWPESPGAQQQMEHLDFIVNDLEQAVQHAIHCGATLAKTQFSESWKVMLDPAGHPFCLCLMNAVLESPNCALL